MVPAQPDRHLWHDGQFRTPRHFINLIVALIDLSQMKAWLTLRVARRVFPFRFSRTSSASTPASGLGRGRLSGDKLTPAQWKFLENHAFTGFDNDANMVKVAILNMYLHKMEKRTSASITR